MRKSINEESNIPETTESSTHGSINIEYKDRLFKAIFGKPENKEWTLSLYNAVNGSHYENADDIEFTTIDDVLYIKMKNDVSFLVDNIMNLYEQQSTYNPNMPMRMFVYAGMIYSNYIETNKKYLRYSSKLQKAPAPKLICFYNGTREAEDKEVLKLSDAFGIDDPDIEVKVTMININYGHNKELLDACKPLREYSWLIGRILINKNTTGSIEKAVDLTLDQMDKNAVIRPFLIKNRAEVKNMFLTEYDEARTNAEMRADGYEDGFEAGIDKGREEGREEGRAEGREEGAFSTLINLVNKGRISINEAAEEAGVTVEEFKSKTGLK